MAKVSSFPQTLWHWFANHAISPIRHTLWTDLTTTVIDRLKRLGQRCIRILERQGLGVGLFALLGTSLLMVWNGALLIALLIGLGVALLVQQLHPHPTLSWQTVSKWLSGPYPTTLLSGGCGLLSLVASYMTLLIWQETDSFWLAFAILLQGLGLLSVLGLFFWQMQRQDQQHGTAPQLDYWINNLTALDPLKRLIAVRQISHWVASTPYNLDQTQELREYLQLLSQRESDPSVQSAIAQGLKRMTVQ
ncbi:hypothetical protein [Acaryochloris sp. IP29b_bin.148]|uniref:hypothetical protein n=1 Tax=Acaryochloris sp. IP29b_bin.148 TaxID=2969218 RepID=UPI00261F0434|nr:hypothetical protein [Acaryochloris sp. IP29b_bin.148]